MGGHYTTPTTSSPTLHFSDSHLDSQWNNWSAVPLPPHNTFTDAPDCKQHSVIQSVTELSIKWYKIQSRLYLHTLNVGATLSLWTSWICERLRGKQRNLKLVIYNNYTFQRRKQSSINFPSSILNAKLTLCLLSFLFSCFWIIRLISSFTSLLQVKHGCC